MTTEIKLSIPISLSGRYSLQGRESYEGLSLWVKEVNDSGGIRVTEDADKLPVRLVHYDDESSTERCREITETLISEDKVDVLIGPYSSGLTLAAAEVAENHEHILWNHGGSSDEIQERGLTWLVNSITPASRYLTGVVDMVRKLDESAHKAAIFWAGDSGFSANVADGAQQRMKKHGFEIMEFKYPSGTSDFSYSLKRTKEFSPDIILGVGRMEDDLLLAERMLEQGIHAKAMGLVVAGIMKFKEKLGENSEGFLGPSQWESGSTIEPDFGPTSREFSHMFKREYGKPPDYPAAQAYNIGLIIQKCIQNAGSLDKKALIKTAEEAEFKTFYGAFKVDPATGKQTGHQMVIVQWQQGRKLIVFPEEAAQAEPVYPKPKLV